jgi:hypothetical protein
VTGGTFYDSSAGSADYRGNFFFSDFNSGLIMRARLSGTDVLSVEPWASGHLETVDMDIGPDGDIYHVSYGGPGGVFRERFRATSQGIVVSKTNVWMIEGGVSTFGVRLATAPTGSLRVAVRQGSGNARVTISEGAALTFGSSNALTPQVVRLSADVDLDTTTDTAELLVTSNGIPTERVVVHVIDEIVAEPPGEGGAGGQSSGGEGGQATGGRPGGGEGGESAGGTAGRAGAGGTSTDGGMAGEDSGGDGSPGEADPGCGCALERRNGSAAGALVLALLLLRRRRWYRGQRK